MRQKKRNLKKILSSIHIALDNYDDIFSDFDISPYETRALSQDFVDELESRVGWKQKELTIVFSLPKKERDPKIEKIVKKRISEYFEGKMRESDYELRKLERKGALFVVIGIFFLICAIYVPSFIHSPRLADIVGDVITTPLGWFFTWTGLSMLIEEPADIRDDQYFYEKLKNANIVFVNEEDVFNEVK